MAITYIPRQLMLNAEAALGQAKSAINTKTVIVEKIKPPTHTTKSWSSLDQLHKGVYSHALMLFKAQNKVGVSTYINEKYKTLTTNEERDTFKNAIRDAKKEYEKWVEKQNSKDFSTTNISKAEKTYSINNAFKGNLIGQCTWYAYGRVIELVKKGELSDAVGKSMEDAFIGKSNRHAKNWPTLFLNNQKWYSPEEIIKTPSNIGKKGFLVVWDQPKDTGHVAFVEKIFKDKDGIIKMTYSQFNASSDQKYSQFTQPMSQKGFYSTKGNLLFKTSSFKILPL